MNAWGSARQLTHLCVYLGCLIPHVAMEKQASPCARNNPVTLIESAKASRNERRQAFGFLRLWPHDVAHSTDEQEARTRTKDSIMIALQRSFGSDLERVLLSLLSPAEATRDPRMAQAATGVYLWAHLPEQSLRYLLTSSTSNSQRVILFDALASVEGPRHEVSGARATVVCQVASQSIRISDNRDWTWDVLDHFLFVVRQEAEDGSEPARAILSDSLVRTAASVLRRD